MSERLFDDRVATVLAWLTECELATLERLRRLKSTPQSELRRHETICNDAVLHCADLKIEPRELHGLPCPRLAEAIANIKPPPRQGKA